MIIVKPYRFIVTSPFCSGRWRSPHKPSQRWAIHRDPCPLHRYGRCQRIRACTRSGTWDRRSVRGSCSGRFCCSRGFHRGRGYEVCTPVGETHSVNNRFKSHWLCKVHIHSILFSYRQIFITDNEPGPALKRCKLYLTQPFLLSVVIYHTIHQLVSLLVRAFAPRLYLPVCELQRAPHFCQRAVGLSSEEDRAGSCSLVLYSHSDGRRWTQSKRPAPLCTVFWIKRKRVNTEIDTC